MMRLVVGLVVVGMLAVGCASNEANPSDDVSNLSSADNSGSVKADVVDNTVPPNQVTTSTPAEAAPLSKPVASSAVSTSYDSIDAPAQKVAVHKRHKKLARKKPHKKHKKHHVAKAKPVVVPPAE
jgi:hypothetical protein